MNSTQLILLIVVLSIAVSSKNKENRIILVSLSLLLFFCMNKEIILQGFCVPKADVTGSPTCDLNKTGAECTSSGNCVEVDTGGCAVAAADSDKAIDQAPTQDTCIGNVNNSSNLADAATDCEGTGNTKTGCEWTVPTVPAGGDNIARTCADINGDGTADDPFDCSGETNTLAANPGDTQCSSEQCSPSDCCTGSPKVDCSSCVVDELFWLTAKSGDPIPTWSTYAKQMGGVIQCTDDPDNDSPTSCEQCSPGTISDLITNVDKGDDVKCVDQSSYGGATTQGGAGAQADSGNDGSSQSYYEEIMAFFKSSN